MCRHASSSDIYAWVESCWCLGDIIVWRPLSPSILIVFLQLHRFSLKLGLK